MKLISFAQGVCRAGSRAGLNDPRTSLVKRIFKLLDATPNAWLGDETCRRNNVQGSDYVNGWSRSSVQRQLHIIANQMWNTIYFLLQVFLLARERELPSD